MKCNIWKCIISFFDSVAKIAAGTVAIIALLSLYPPFAVGLKLHYAKHFNPVGYVRYKVDKKFKPAPGITDLRAIKTGDRSFKALKAGDILMVITSQNFRALPNADKENEEIFTLKANRCVMVVDKEPSNDTYDGWLKAVTTSCSFFD